MATSPPRTSGCVALIIIIIGIEQIGVYFTTLMLAMMLGQGFYQFFDTDVGYTYGSWFCLSMLVATVSSLQSVLSVLFMWAMIKRNQPGLLSWVAAMTWTNVAQGLTMLAMVAVMLREEFTFSEDRCSITPADLKVELDHLRISLSPRPVDSVAYLLINCYGKWFLAFGVFWCCVLLLNSYSVKLIVAEIKRKGHKNSPVMNASRRNEEEALLNEGRTSAIPATQHQNVQMRVVSDIEEQNGRNSLYPVADLHMVQMMATHAEGAPSQFSPSAPPPNY